MWRRAFDKVERAVGPGLADVTASAAFRDAVAAGTRINTAVAREVERTSRQWLHAWNLPAAGDVRNLRRQVSALEKEIRLLRSVVAASGAPPTPRPDTTGDPWSALTAPAVESVEV